MIIRAFPLHWDYRRVCEILIAGYSCAVGLLFMIYPATLSPPIYDSFGGEARAPLIGLMLMTFAFLHSFGLWLNGINHRMSRAVRTVACLGHSSVMIFFGYAFAIAGAYWGCVTMTLIVFMIYLALTRAFDPCR